VLTALGVLRMLPVLQRLGDAYGFYFCGFLRYSGRLSRSGCKYTTRMQCGVRYN